VAKILNEVLVIIVNFNTSLYPDCQLGYVLYHYNHICIIVINIWIYCKLQIFFFAFHVSYAMTVNKVRELIVVKQLHTSLLNTTMVAFKVLPLGSYAPMPAPSPPFKTILKLVLCIGLQSCRRITPDVINVIKCLSFIISSIFGKRKMSLGARSGE